MHAAIRLPLAFVGLQLAYSGVVWACSCAQDPLLTDPMGTADAAERVFIGEVVKVGEARSAGCGGTISSADPVEIEFEVIDAIKGVDDGEELTLVTARSGSSCGVETAEGEVWLLALEEGSDSLGLCGPGGRLDAGYQDAADILLLEAEGAR